MDKVIFQNPWKQYFTRFGVGTFDDFYRRSGMLTVGKNARRDVQRFTVDGAGDGKVFFMKRFRRPRLKDVCGAAYHFGNLTSQARVEWENARYLLQNQIDTYRPVCLGERSRMGMEIESFFITRKFDGACLLDVVLDRWPSLSRAEQEGIIVAGARFVRRLHDCGVSFPDLYVWHLFIRRDHVGADYRLSIIDLHRMTRRVQGKRARAKDLGRLHWSMSGKYFDREHKVLLISTYLEDGGSSDAATFLRSVEGHATVLARKRTLARYYGRTAEPIPERISGSLLGRNVSERGSILKYGTT